MRQAGSAQQCRNTQNEGQHWIFAQIVEWPFWCLSRSFNEGPEVNSFGTRILLVEDHELLRRTTTILLEGKGFQGIRAVDGPTALQVLEEVDFPFDLIITDFALPGTSGLTVVRTAKSRHPNIRIIYMSGYNAEVLTAFGVNLSLAVLVQKPFDCETLCSAIAKAVAKSDCQS